MSINPNELRLGNLIYVWNDQRFESVVDIGILKDVLNPIYNTTVDSLFEPIPLTETWLLKMGLIADETSRLFRPNETIHKKCEGDIGLKSPSFFFNTRLNRWMDCQTRVCIDYVHQLQNLVFALTGEELTAS